MAPQHACWLWTGLFFASFLTSQGFRGQLVQVAEAPALACLFECASSACKAGLSHVKEPAQAVANEQSQTVIKHSFESCMAWGKNHFGDHQIHVVIENDFKGELDTVKVVSVDLERGSTGESHDVFGERISSGSTFQFFSYGRRGVGVLGTVRVRSKEGHYWIIKFAQSSDGSVHASAGYKNPPSDPKGTSYLGIGKTGGNKVTVKLAVVADGFQIGKEQTRATGAWGRFAGNML